MFLCCFATPCKPCRAAAHWVRGAVVLFIRSLIFNIAFYVTTALWMILFTPFYFIGPREKAWWAPNFWSRCNVWLLRHIVGVRFEVSGTENLPQSGFIIAPKHQSAFDTFCFLPWLSDPVLILKRILMWVPLFGWYVARMKMIPIDRGNREQAIRKVNAGAKYALSNNRQLLIYPEGTRRAPGAEPAYKSGIAYLYEKLDVPVVAIAHNAGLFWPKNSFMRYPGTLKAEFLPPIEPGLTREAFQARLIAETETACDRLLLEVADGPNPPPFGPAAQKRIAELRAAIAETQPS